jgi:molybdate transport system substrate-binding protein
MNESTTVHLLSGGAAQGLVMQLQAKFQTQSDGVITGNFGAVGVMKDCLLAGEACDVIILTEALIGQLTGSGNVVAGSAQALGVVKTGIAVKVGEAVPDVSNPGALKAALLSATGIYFPDPVKATAGIHFMKVLKALGVDATLADRLRPFANGTTAMREMAQCPQAGLLGCTQVTEILYTPGIKLVAPLPEEFELATVYTAAVCAGAKHPGMAQALIDLLAGAEAAAVRRTAGFVPQTHP